MSWRETKDWATVEKVESTRSWETRRATMEEWESWLNREKRNMDDSDLASLFQSQTGLRPPIEIKTTKWIPEAKPLKENVCRHCGKKVDTKYSEYDSDSPPAA